MTNLEKENGELKQLLNANGTNIIIKRAKRETDVKILNETIEKWEANKHKPICTVDRVLRISML